MKPLLSALAILFCASISWSQTPTPTPQGGVEDVVKISTTLIQIDATVTDKKGNLVKGLTADDFEIYENDKAQVITNFSFVELQPDLPPVAREIKPDKNFIPIPLPPTKLRPEQVQRTVALVVDDLRLSFGSTYVVRSALKKFVDEQMQPGDLVAIIRTSSGVGALQQFTSDKRMLHAAIKRVRWYAAGSGGIGLFQWADPSDMGALEITSQLGGKGRGIEETRDSNQQFDEFREDIFAIGTLGAINYVVKGMRELPGRKSMVLFAEGMGLVRDNPNPRLMNIVQRLTEFANRSSVIFYAMDPRGVVNTLMLEAQDSFEGLNNRAITSNIDRLRSRHANDLYHQQVGLRAFAERTGGFAVTNNNDLSKGLERVLNDLKGYYLLGYRPDSETFNPKKARFNRLTVRLKRPDLRIRYRSGFFGIREEDARPEVKTPRQQIISALTSPLRSGDIRLSLTALFADDAQTGAFMRSVVYVNGRDLKFTEETDGWQRATFEVVAMIFGDNGVVFDEVSRTETIKARAETLHEIREKGFVSTITFPIKKSGAYQMRLVIRDAATSRIGSASEFIEVPNLKKNRLTLSGILLERVQTAISDNRPRPFQTDQERDVATRSFQPGMTVRFGYGIYNARLSRDTKTSRLTMQFRIFHGVKELFVSKEKSVSLIEQSDPKRLLAQGMFTLGKATQPGDYVLQVIIRDQLAKEKDRIATQWIDFEVVE